MVVPIEEDLETGERLIVIERDGEDLITRNLGAVRFVPMQGVIRKTGNTIKDPALLKEALQGSKEEQKQSLPPKEEESMMQTPIRTDEDT